MTIRGLFRRAHDEIKVLGTIRSMKKTRGNNLLVFGAPYHSNMGDQAQSYCIQKWAEHNYPDYKTWILDTRLLSFNKYQLIKRISRLIRETDKIFLHSGYHTTDLYMLEENMQRCVISLFPDNQIVFLPQTILYTKQNEEKTSSAIYNQHKDLVMLCRDEVSFETANKIFSACRLLEFPDVVTSEIGLHRYSNQRSGILLCMRNDKEAFYSRDQIDKLKRILSRYGRVDQSDTTLALDPNYINKNRKKILESMWEKYSTYRLIITDRYHGTIFSLIANTPVLVLSSADHKLSSGVKWFPKKFHNYVRYVPKFSDIQSEVERVFSTTYDYRLPPYFKLNYFDKLKDIIQKNQ